LTVNLWVNGALLQKKTEILPIASDEKEVLPIARRRRR
jgi:hypothetical protein